jgi:hypothetical protein
MARRCKKAMFLLTSDECAVQTAKAELNTLKKRVKKSIRQREIAKYPAVETTG